MQEVRNVQAAVAFTRDGSELLLIKGDGEIAEAVPLPRGRVPLRQYSDIALEGHTIAVTKAWVREPIFQRSTRMRFKRPLETGANPDYKPGTLLEQTQRRAEKLVRDMSNRLAKLERRERAVAKVAKAQSEGHGEAKPVEQSSPESSKKEPKGEEKPKKEAKTTPVDTPSPTNEPQA